MPDGPSAARQIKKELRNVISGRRKRLLPGLRSRLSALVTQQVLASREYQEAGTILTFASFGEEVETDTLIREILRSGRRCGLTRVTPGGLQSYLIRDIENDLTLSAFGIREPAPERCEPVGVDGLDLLLLPGLVFDAHGMRVGYGAGHFDRYLSAKTTHAPVFALAYGCQIVKTIPREPHDVLIDGVITESEFLWPGRASVTVQSEAEMENLGERIGAAIPCPASLALVGELGAGKTTFTRGLLRAWNAGESAVSPTYLLVNEYGNETPIRHLDAYRLDEQRMTPEDTELLTEALDSPAYAVIEWADRVPSLVPPYAIRIEFETLGPESRRITVATSRRRDRDVLAACQSSA